MDVEMENVASTVFPELGQQAPTADPSAPHATHPLQTSEVVNAQQEARAREKLEQKLKALKRQQIQERDFARNAVQAAKLREFGLQRELYKLRSQLEAAPNNRLNEEIQALRSTLVEKDARIKILEQRQEGFEALMAVFQDPIVEPNRYPNMTEVEIKRECDRYRGLAREAWNKYDAERTARTQAERMLVETKIRHAELSKINGTAFNKLKSSATLLQVQAHDLRALNTTLRYQLHGGYRIDSDYIHEIPYVAPPPYTENSSRPAPPYLRPRVAAAGPSWF